MKDNRKIILEGEEIISYIGKRLDVVLLDVIQKADIKPELLSLMSRSFIALNIKAFVTVNTKVKKAGYKIKVGNSIVVDLDVLNARANDLIDKRDSLLEYKADPNWNSVLDIIDETDDFIIINKPAGIPVHPGVGNTSGTIANYFKGYLIDKGIFDNRLERSGIVHRLDKSVGGLMVLAKNYEAQKSLQELFQAHKVTKLYVATIKKHKNTKYTRLFEKILKEYGLISVKELNYNLSNLDNNPRWVKISGYIGRDTSNRKKMKFRFGRVSASSKSLKAISYITPISDDKIAIKIVTGRTHQIRATVSAIGYDIFGDGLYNFGVNSRPSEVREISLKAVLLSFRFKDNSLSYRISI